MEAPQRLAYLFRRYVERTCSPEEKEEFFSLLLQPGQDDQLRRLIAETWNEDHPTWSQDKTRADSILREILSRRATEFPPALPDPKTPLFSSIQTGLRSILFSRRAASVFGLIVLTTLGYRFFRHSQPASPTIAAQAPVAATIRPADHCITLPDGSKILLHKTAQLDYQSGFSSRAREVTLHGEAYFDIHRDTRPFIVHTGSIRTIVLGTAFNIDAKDERDIVITVTKGKVKVENANGDFSILRRNEQLSVDSSRLQKVRGNVREALAWKKTWLLFNDVPMREAMDTLAGRFHLNVVYTNPAAQNCPVTATFSGTETVDEMINVLSKINNMDYVIAHDRITIRGEGCK
jgi:ferric-dicitrate binding protein FerR (iron transport regulator)